MGFDFLSQAAKFLQEQKNYKRWLAVFLCLAVTTVFGTAAALKMYGQAMTHQVKVLECQYEVHEHTDDCYEKDENGDPTGDPICGCADYVVHVHNDDCYDENGNLVCPLEEIELHEHDENCYEETEVLVCEEGESESVSGHQHTDSCYTEVQGELICEESTEGGHTHDDSCYSSELTCDLEEHTHDDGCYSSELACSDESEEHEHDDGCYSEELTCGQDEHAHGDGCYSETLTCGQDESTAHEHTDACYGTKKELTCTQGESESVEGHTHDDSCYETEETLTCEELELHTHVEALVEDGGCYDESAFDGETGEFIEGSCPVCGIPQLEEHVHTEECFKTVELTPEEIAALNNGAKLHVHTEACYDADGNLICELLTEEPKEEPEVELNSTFVYETDGYTLQLRIQGASAPADTEDGEEPATDSSDPEESTVPDQEGNETGTETGNPDQETTENPAEEEPVNTDDGQQQQDEEAVPLAQSLEPETEETTEEEVTDSAQETEPDEPEADTPVQEEEVNEPEADVPKEEDVQEPERQITISDESGELTLEVIRMNDSDALFAEMNDFIQKAGEPAKINELLELSVLEFHLYRGEEELDLAGCTVKAEITPKAATSEELVEALGEKASAEEGAGIMVSAFRKTAEEIQETGNVFLTPEMEEIPVLESEIPENGILTVARYVQLDSSQIVKVDHSFLYETEDYTVILDIQGNAGYLETEEGEETAAPVGEEAIKLDRKPSEIGSGVETEAGEGEEAKAEESDPEEDEEAKTEEPDPLKPETEPEEADQALKEEISEENGIMMLALDAPAEGAEVLDEAAEEEPDAADETEETEPKTEPDENGGKENNSESDSFDSETEEAEGTVLDSEQVSLNVVTLDQENESYAKMKDFVENESEVAGDLIDLSILEFHMYHEGAELDLSTCMMTAQVTPKEKLLDEIEDLPEETAEDVEECMVISVLQDGEEGIEEADRTFLSTEMESGQMPVMSEIRLAHNQMAMAKAGTPNPNFTVQYYANLPVAVTGDHGVLEVIDTTGKKLPQNSSTQPIRKLVLNDQGGGTSKRSILTQITLTEVYQSYPYKYIEAPNLYYFNRLQDNVSYTLNQIWILKDGKSATSTNVNDWIVCDPKTVHFTNREEMADEAKNVRYIKPNSVIRLVYEPTSAPYQNEVDFYDYDITNGDGKTTSTTTVNGYGINSAENYTGKGNGAKLAFGNANTGTGLFAEKVDGKAKNYLNQYNRSGVYKGCTFGLADSLNKNGVIQYKSNVAVPNLFNEGNATGKRHIDDYKLEFSRVGDTYTLSKVNTSGGTAVLSNLDQFNHPQYGSTVYNHIWTNNFWPMDQKTGADGKTGGSNMPWFNGYVKSGYERGSYTKGAYQYPPSDDGVDHNNMFGMHYTVDFELTADYIGPLEYYFFGDDDMWVFLTKLGEDKNPVSDSSLGYGKLVCDIGGVHSSVGEYVNLWDYISKGSSGNYRLTFFYTERGLSGSTCYMQFTLPTVTSDKPPQQSGSLKVEKKLTGFPEGTVISDEFDFTIMLRDKNGGDLLDDYSYTLYKKDQAPTTDLVLHDGSQFSLADGEYIVIEYLPVGTKYIIDEVESELYETSGIITYPENGEIKTKEISGVHIEGTIDTTDRYEVTYHNHKRYKLPETGGPGTIPFALGSVLVISAGMGGAYILRRKRNRNAA